MFKYYSILIIFSISNIYSQEIPPIQNFTPNDYNAGIQNWMISQAKDHSIVVANGSGILHFNSDWNFYIILNVAMGGEIASDFNFDTMEVDYVRVYQE